MQIKMKCKRTLAFVLALLMLMTMLPTAAFAEELPSDVATSTDVAADPVASQENEPVSEEPTAPDEEAEQPAAEDSTAADDPAVSEEDAPAIESEDIDSSEIPDDTPEESADSIVAEETTDAADAELPVVLTLQETIEANGFAYVRAVRPTKVYNTPENSEDGHIYTLTDTDDVLLATEHNGSSIKIWYYVGADAAMRGYVDADDLSDTCLSEDEVSDLTNGIESREYSTDAGYMTLYLADGEFNLIEEPTTEDAPAEEPEPDPENETMPEEETGNESEADDPAVDDAGEDENAADNAPQEPTDDVDSDEETAADPEATEGEQLPEDELLTGEDETLPDSETDSDDADLIEDETLPDGIEEVLPPALIGDYLQVTTDTRVFSEIDDTATDDYFGDLYLGVFARDAIVRVEEVHQDSAGRIWYLVTFLYGDDFVDGRMKWTATDMIWILADEAAETDQTDLSVTDYAYPLGTPIMRLMSRSATAMNGFSLKSISGSIGSFSVGDTAYGSSGRDRDYPQIATLEGHGKIYATPHYLEGYTVYCLEHTLPGPGENISGGGKQPTGPYTIVDWDGYMSTAGYSGAIYGEDTMHAIAWVLGHTYPFMVLDRSDSNNETWSRVAGQFAIREVIKQMEGAQYVRDYWDMDNFYAASNNAPSVYLEYARWLAENAIAHARRTGKITVSNKNAGYANGSYYGTATYTTDADFMRISKNVGMLTGHTGGEDDFYYYLNSGDTVTVYSSSSSFAYGVESMMDDEAGFYVGVPSVEIQKVLIPIESIPYPTDEAFVDFAVTFGAAVITKTDAGTGAALAGATFEVVNASGTVVTTAKTGADGTAVFENLQAGTYTIRETSAPTGYTLSVPDTQSLTVAAGQTANATFVNEKIRGKIAIYKVDADSKEPLAGAAFSVTDANGNIVATLVTDANGTAETDWLPYGTYDVTETAAPDRYINSGASVNVSITEHGKTYTVEAENEPMKGGLIVRKKDAVTGAVIEDVQFDIYRDGELIATMTTDANGVATCNGLDAGTYTIKEHALPTGYVGELVVLEGTVASDVTTVLDATNMPFQSKIKIIKTDSVTGEMLPGAEFSIANAAGITIGKLITGEDGTTTSGWLPYGVYTITETQAPDSYINRGFSTRIEAFENGKTYTINVENEPTKGGIKVIKMDALTQLPIAGVQFDVFQGDTLVGTMTTNAQGIAIIEDLEKGTYTVKEHALPTGYVGELTEMTAVVVSDQITELPATNTPSRSKVRIVKTDALSGAVLPGAEFTITDAAGNVVEVLTTGVDGKVESGWLTYGTYIVTESKAPEHYVNSGFAQSFDAFEDGKTYEFTVSNAPNKGGIRLTKTDSETGAFLSGVKFNIYRGDELVASMVTDENGVASCDNLDRGTYLVKEDALPEGYSGELVVLEATVQSDAVTELHAVNCKSKSQIRIVKTDDLTGEAVSGAEFTVTDESGNVAAVITTDATGEAVTDWLPYGIYTVSETKTPEHYVTSDWSETVAAFENGVTYTFEVSNNPTKGYLQITKTDALDGTLIEGVQFDIYQGDKLISTMTTGADGIATSEALPKGTYTVKEHSLPEGYTGELATMEAVVKSDESTQLAANNQPIMGQIRIEKSDALTGEMLACAEFTITRNTGLPSHKGSNDGEVVAVMTTDADGVAVSPLLTWGTYTVVETKIPEHYENQPFEAVVTINEHEQTYTIEAENEPTMGYIRVVKTNSLDQMPIAGVQFDIYQDGEVVASMTTDEKGVAVSPALPKGEYTVREYETPVGYISEVFQLNAEVCSDETTELAVTNKPIQGKIRIEKQDALTGDHLAGATFTVTRISGLPSHNGNGNGEVVATITTDVNGIAETPMLTYGVYRVDETIVPEHYVDNSFSVEVTINEEDEGTYLVECENEPTKGWIQHVKVDALDRTPIAGVVFDIYNGGELISSMTTNADGVALSEPLHKGEYMVCERDNPTGYTGELIVLDAVVKSDETTHLSCTNQPMQGRIQIMKRDQLTKEALAGAEFTVTRIAGLPSHNGSNDGEVVAVITTDANGMAITPLLTWGTYRVEETGVPEHYVDNSFSVEITITEDQKIYTVDVENEPTKGWIRLTKTDRMNGNPIEGVQFDIFYNDQYGEGMAGTMVTDANGIAMSEPLRKGQYIVREHGETAGYVFEEIELAATVKSDEITDVAATNMPVLVQLTIYKRDLDEYDGDDPNTNPRNKAIPTMPNDYHIPDPVTRGDGVLTGTVFQVSAGADILDRQGNVIYPEGTVIIDSLTTAGDTASVTTEPLWPGLYAVQEITAPTGYQIDPNPFFVDTSGAAMQSAVPTVVYPGLSRNEILYGAQAIVKVLGNNDNTTDPTRVEIPEAGAEFRVFLKSAGSYENARDFERDYLITDEHGYAMTKPLSYGVYVLEQTAGKDGYEIKGPIEFSIDGTESLVNPSPLTLSDKPILYRLKLIKTDADTGKIITLANTSFKIKDSQGKYITQTVYYPREMEIDTFVTDATGSVTLPEVINWGHYFIEEIVAPEGYLIRTDELAVFIGNAGDQPGQTYEVEIEIPNEAVMGRIELVKTGLTLTGFMSSTEHGYEVTRPIYEDRYLAGATFEIRAAEDIIGGDGTLWYTKDALVETITTSGTGSDMSKELPLGRYYLIETGAPVGYILEDVPYEADLTYLDGNTPVVTIQVRAGNKYLPASVALVKHKEETKVVTSENGMVHQVITTAPGEGFTFGLYNAKDIHYVNGTLMADTLMAVGVTDEQGLLHISGYFPHGEFYIKELAAPAGWQINPDAFPVSILPDMVAEDAAVIQIVYPEVVYDELIYTPITLTKTDITGVDTLPGALIEVMNSEGTLIYREFTDANGEIPDIPVVPGTYSFREVYAPEGYELNTTEMTFTVDELGNITGDTVIRDDYTCVTLVKKDMDGNPLAGVEFGLLRDDKSLMAVTQSDAKGIVTFEKIPFGKYTIREVQPLPGYLLNDTVVHLTVDNTFVNPVEPLAVIENHPIEVILHKIDKDNKPLPGAIFGLFDSDGFLCMTALSDVTGTVKFSYVPYGSYTVRELEAPDGYLLSQAVIPVEINATYQNSVEPLATVVNHAARLRYKKVDTSGKLLPGVEFSLINADTGEIVEIVTSDDAGEFVFTRFTYGNWIVRETRAPEGYNIMPDIKLKVDESWVEPEPFTLVNIPNHYEFVKTDNKGNPMPGVKFTLEDGAGNILRDLVSGEDGIVHVTDLTPGVYIIREIETLEGYTLSEETIKVVIDDKYIVPDEMFRFVNYPNIQTGAGFEMTSLMWSGVALLSVSCAAVMAYILLNKRRPRI